MTGDSTGLNRIFEIRPNRSLSRTGMIIFFILVVVVSIAVAIRFWLLGAWVVLPFTILEMLVLGGGLYFFERSTRYRELIEIRPNELLVIVEHGMKTLQQWDFQPYWVQVILQLDHKSWYPSKLFLCSHGRRIQVGACLTDDDRKELAKHLKRVLLKHRSEKIDAL